MAAMAVRFVPVLARSVSFVKQATPYLTFFVVVGSGPATTGGVFRHASLVIVRSVFLKTDLVFFRGLCFAAGKRRRDNVWNEPKLVFVGRSLFTVRCRGAKKN